MIGDLTLEIAPEAGRHERRRLDCHHQFRPLIERRFGEGADLGAAIEDDIAFPDRPLSGAVDAHRILGERQTVKQAANDRLHPPCAVCGAPLLNIAIRLYEVGRLIDLLLGREELVHSLHARHGHAEWAQSLSLDHYAEQREGRPGRELQCPQKQYADHENRHKAAH